MKLKIEICVEVNVLRSGRRFTQRLKATRLCWMPPPTGLQLSRTTQLFHFRFADTEQYWLITLTFPQDCLCSFTKLVLAQLDLLRNLMFSKAYKNVSYLSLKKLSVTVAKLHFPALNAELTVLARIKQFILHVSSLDLLFPVNNVNDYGMASTVACTQRCGQGLRLRGSGTQSVTRQFVHSVTKQMFHPRCERKRSDDPKTDHVTQGG